MKGDCERRFIPIPTLIYLEEAKKKFLIPLQYLSDRKIARLDTFSMGLHLRRMATLQMRVVCSRKQLHYNCNS